MIGELSDNFTDFAAEYFFASYAIIALFCDRGTTLAASPRVSDRESRPLAATPRVKVIGELKL